MFRKILLAVDVNALEGAERLAEAARLLCAPGGGEIHLINVVPSYGMAIVGAAFDPAHNQQLLEAARAELERWAATALPEGTALHVVQGSVYDSVLRLAREIGADAIVVGAHRPELRDYLIGPNAARIVRHADQSVFVIREPSPPPGG